MIRVRTVKIPLYGGKFTILFYETWEELQESFNNELNIEKFDGCVFNWKGKDYIAIQNYFNEEHKVQYPTPGIIAHEAKHMVNNIFIDIHHKLDPYNYEPECYLLGWIVNRIHEFLNQINNENNNKPQLPTNTIKKI